MRSDSTPPPDFFKWLARAALLLLGSCVAGYLAPEVAAFGLVSVALLAGYFWKYVGWQSVFVFGGGLVGLAARNSGGNPDSFHSNLAGMAAVAVLMVGIGVMAGGASGSRRSGRRR